MRRITTMLAATLLGILVLACSPPVATCDDDDDCPGDLRCDDPTGICALPAAADPAGGRSRALAEEPSDEGAPADEEPSPEEPPSEEPPPEEPPPGEPPGDDDDEEEGEEEEDGGGGWGCWPGDDDDEGAAPGDEDGSNDLEGSDDDDEGGQCLQLEEECSFEDDACCEHAHCCPVFRICVPNFWE